MQIIIHVLVLMALLFAHSLSLTWAFSLHPRSSFGRAANLPAPFSSCSLSSPPPAIFASRPVCTSLAVAKLDQPGPPAPLPPWVGIVGFVVVIFLEVTQGQTQMSQGQMLATLGETQVSQGQTQMLQGQMLATLSSKFDMVAYFVVGVIGLASFGSSVVNILEYQDGLKEKKKDDAGKDGKKGGGKSRGC